MKILRSIVSTIVLAAVAACGTTSASYHRSAALGYENAAQAARSRGDATEASRFDALAKEEIGEAQAADQFIQLDNTAP